MSLIPAASLDEPPSLLSEVHLAEQEMYPLKKGESSKERWIIFLEIHSFLRVVDETGTLQGVAIKKTRKECARQRTEYQAQEQRNKKKSHQADERMLFG